MRVTLSEARELWCPYRLTLGDRNKCEGAGCMAFIMDGEVGFCGMLNHSHGLANRQRSA